MKTTRILAALVLGLGLTASAVMANVNDQIRDRTKPVGELCMEGEECEGVKTSSSGGGGDSDEPREGDEVYADACQSCHDSGAAGAPKFGDEGDWEDRADKDTDELYSNAINGIGNMPAKGGCGSCSDEEIEKAVDHMLAELE